MKEKNFQGENQSKKRKGKEFSFFCGFQTFNDVRLPFFYVGRNACFNKVFKLTVTNNFQSCLCFGGEKSALKLKAYFFVLLRGKKLSLMVAKADDTITYKEENAKTAKDER